MNLHWAGLRPGDPGNDMPDAARGRPNPTKSVIRAEAFSGPEMVTGEFYARVTTAWVTGPAAAPKLLRDKRPVGRWLRPSSYNFPDQRDAVIKSLSKNFVVFDTVAGAANGA
ncbi:hypothetical protein GCM10010409_34550 [Mycolicibacterium diernhoferi]